LLLRALAVVGVSVGFAGPVWHNQPIQAKETPLLIIMDGGWAAAPQWDMHRDQALQVIDQAGRDGRPVGLLVLAAPAGVQFRPAPVVGGDVAVLEPRPWLPDAQQALMHLADISQPFDTYWISAPVAFDQMTAIVDAADIAGDVTVFDTGATAMALRPAQVTPDGVDITVLRSAPVASLPVALQAMGTDPAGNLRVLNSYPITLPAGVAAHTISIPLPAELRNRITRFDMAGVRTAGAVTLTDDALRRREIALIAATAKDQEGLALLSQLHFLRQALVPNADLLDGAIQDVLQANPDTIILADVARVPNEAALADWVAKGGMLIRFAGPRLAADLFDRTGDDPLLPVRLRAGGRTVGGAMSWGAPKTLRAFGPDSPFAGLPIPADVQIQSQVLAEPGPDLAARTIARLDDGTPLVTSKPYGQGQVVLFHVTANTQWSNLPLSGLFLSMLDRLSVASGQAPITQAQMVGSTWALQSVLDGYGVLRPQTDRAGMSGETLAGPLSDQAPPGLYAGTDRILARNVVATDDIIMAPNWPATVQRAGPGGPNAVDLAPWILMAALALILCDVIAALVVSGKLRGPVAVILAIGLVGPQGADAQDISPQTLRAASEVVLAYVITGDRDQDDISHAGLYGLSQTLFFRTSIEPDMPQGIDLETDDLALYPFLYWPITPNQLPPSADTLAKLNRYLRGGGMILFDTRDGNMAGFGTQTPLGRTLQILAQGLQLPPLAPIAPDHVLTRSFYLLQDFPGRHRGGPLWVEAPAKVDEIAGQPFRNLNDGVTPVVIGANDWAAAWATTPNGRPLRPVGRGAAGDQQREMARRFGVNLIMHVLTGNYKSDQIHVPDLLNRLGQ
ncbi:MAG: DUF4159 domain-containing protein, partial [Pseudomonadota bacterium]